MDVQELINWSFGVIGILLGAILKTLWQAVKDLQTTDTALADKVAKIELVVAGSYVSKDEFARLNDAIFKKLDKMADKIDRIDDKLDTKADK